MNLSLYEFVYAFNLISLLIFLYAIFKSYKETKLPLSIKRVLGYATHELKKGVSTVAGYMHFSIIFGATLSIFYSVFWPLVINTFLWPILLAISIPFDAGLIAGLFWRLNFFSRSLTIHEYLKVKSDLKRDSILFQAILTITTALTLSNLALAWYPELFIFNSSVSIIRNILALIYVKPLVNSMLNYGRPIYYLETPFNLKDILEGKINIEDVKTGVENVNELNTREKLSLKSCVEIGVCDDVCPATKVGRPLSPRVLIRKLSILLKKTANADPFEVINEDELWSCTTCGACTYSCPVSVRHLEIIMDLRRTLTESAIIDRNKSAVFSSVSRYGNTFGISNHNRHNWLTELGVKTVNQNQNYKHLLWVGCLSSFDERLRKTIEALIAILKNIGKLDEVAVLGDYETCSGDPVRKLGEEGLYQEIVLKNIELFEKYHVSSILTTCPHCYNAFKNDYPELGLKNIEVIHHAEFLNKLLEDGSLKLKTTNEIFAIHDPCYLSRYNKITDVLKSLVGKIGDVKRPKYHGEKTFCCGAGGGNYWYEVPEKRRISHERLEQLLDLKPKIIATFCPYCNAVLHDAVQAKELEGIEVLDAAEIVYKALNEFE